MSHPQPLAEGDDQFDALFPGCTLTHKLTVVSHDGLGTAIEVLSAVRAWGGVLDALHLTRVGGKAEHRLSVAGLRPRQARLLSGRLAALPGVERAAVEHCLLRTAR